MRKRFSRLALCGVLAAFGIVLMCMGTLIPVATYCCPMLVSLLLIPVTDLCGTRNGLLWYLAVSILSLLMAPDREASLIFLLLGYYPVLCPGIRKLPKLPRILVKLAIINLAVFAVYGILSLFGLETFASELTGASAAVFAAVMLAMLAAVNAVFFTYDLVLERFSILWRVRWKHQFT